MATYGQLKDGKAISYKDFENEVATRLRRCIISNYNLSTKLCRKLYRQGYSIEDACSFLILNAK
jgi:SOS response regulatory protein OraA/RecX